MIYRGFQVTYIQMVIKSYEYEITRDGEQVVDSGGELNSKTLGYYYHAEDLQEKYNRLTASTFKEIIKKIDEYIGGENE